MATSESESTTAIVAQEKQYAHNGTLIAGLVGGVFGLLCLVGTVVALIVIDRRRNRGEGELATVVAPTVTTYQQTPSDTIYASAQRTHFYAVNKKIYIYEKGDLRL